MTMKRIGTAALLLSALALTTSGCLTGKNTSEQGTKMTAEEHKKAYPKGHDRSLGKNCYYDSETDSFFCTFE